MGERAASPKTFLIADVRGYTRFTQEHGDAAASALVESFLGTTEPILGEHGGELVETRGDEVLAAFDSTRGALEAAVEMQRALVSNEGGPIPVGIGIDIGEAVPHQDGYLGNALNLASRLCGVAAPGEILTTREVAHVAHRVDGASATAGSRTSPSRSVSSAWCRSPTTRPGGSARSARRPRRC
jgi:adenylate cyclase